MLTFRYSHIARVYNVCDVMLILAATVVIIIETDPHISANQDAVQTLATVDICVTIYFTIELIMRYTVCPDKLQLSLSPMTWIDLLAVFPFYFELIITKCTDAFDMDYLAVVRLGRIFRIFKLIKRNQKLRVTFVIFSKITNDLVFLFSLWFINVIFFGVSSFYFENVWPYSEIDPVCTLFLNFYNFLKLSIRFLDGN